MNTAYIALGSNLNHPLLQLRQAICTLSKQEKLRVTKQSSAFINPALTLSGEKQADYVNAVIRVTTTLTAVRLLELLLQIENQQGRVRKSKWDARSLDLDLLLYENVQINSKKLTLPHPRMQQRVFVILPLWQIAPQLTLPDGNKVKDVLDKLDSSKMKEIKIKF